MAFPRQALVAAFTAVAAWTLAAPIAAAQSLIRDTEIEAIIRSQFDPVLMASGLNPRDVRVVIVNDNTLNAFATQGQIIGVNTGLIIEAETPNQLLGVLAHEAGHVSGGHAVRNEMQQAGTAPFILTAGLGVLAALAGAPSAGAALLANSTYFGALGALGYSRTQEGAADQAAVTALERAGLSSEGLVEFFDNYRYQEVFSEDRRFPFFRSHPLSSDRIEALRARVANQRHRGVRDTPEAMANHRLIKAKLSAFLNPPTQTLRTYPETDTSFEARYARAIAWYRATEIPTALTQIDALLVDHPENAYLWELKGQVLFEAGRAAEAVPAHAKSVELNPDAALLRINHAQALIATGVAANIDAAIQELDRANALEPRNPLSWRLMSEAYGARGEEGPARLASAE
ncbi:MAG TPA: M48 family metalloprotease, partial [Caulobacteraceae bacterium]